MAVTRSWGMALVLVFSSFSALSGQDQAQSAVKAQIRKLDNAEAEAILQRDSAALRNIWATDLTVNNPGNSITRGSEEVIALIRNGIIDYSSFVRQIDEILVHESTVIVMGSETIKPVNKAPFAGQTVRRRFTHVWMLRDGQWRLTARHDNVVCPT